MNTSRSLAMLAALVLWGAGQTRADTWSGLLFSSDWFLQGNWSLLDGPPGATEDAVFPTDFSGGPVTQTDVHLSSSTTVRRLFVQSPFNGQYTFTGSSGTVLTATEVAQFSNSDFQTSNVHTLSSLGLNTPQLQILQDAILSLNNSTVQTDNYAFFDAAGQLRVNSGGELRVTGDTALLRGKTIINSGGQLNALSGVDLEYNGTALLQFFSGHAVDAGVHLKATGGGDITGASFIDVGNGTTGTLTVTGSGTTFTAGGSINSDWGLGSSGNATVTIADSAVATVNELQSGTSNAQFAGTVSGGATLRTTSTFTMGGGATIRQVSLDVNGGTFEVDGSATFNSFADLNLTAGTVNFDGGATFNAIGRMDWSGGNVNLGAGTTLLVDGGTVNNTISTSGFIFSAGTTTRIKSGGTFTTQSYFDLGNATLDMNSANLTVGTAGGTVSDWGANSTNTTATLSNNAVATYHSGLRMSINGGTTNATITSGARLVGSFLSIGGGTGSNVTLNVNGGRVESPGTISLFRGSTTTVSVSGRIEAQDIVLGFPGGTASLTVTGAGSFLDANATLFAGREGTTTLTISGSADAEATTRTVIGEIAGANSTVNVTGSGSSLFAGSSLTVGDGGAATLNVVDEGFVVVAGGVTVNGSSKIDLDLGSLEIGVSSSIANGGEIELTAGSQIRGDISNAGVLRMIGSSVTRGVTLLADSQMFADNSSVATLVQQADAELLLELRGASNFDNLSATGAATLGGELVVSLAGGFAPALGAQFTILSAASVSGPFGMRDFSAAPLGSGLAWHVLYSATNVTLKVIAVVPGDYNYDGTVNAADYVVWRDNLGAPAGTLPNDTAGGMIGQGQYNLWRANFGATAGPAAGSSAVQLAAVPEPMTLLMLLMAITVAGLPRHRTA